MRRADINLQEQLEKRKNWKDPLVDAAVATILVRKVPENCCYSIDEFEFLVTERVGGAEKGQLQAHHGGFLKVTDVDIYEGAAREVQEETGYKLHPALDLFYLTTIGPSLYRSELFFERERNPLVRAPRHKLLLLIKNQEAEPSVGFALPVFWANVTDMQPLTKTDGEVKDPLWMTAPQIIEQFGRQEDRPYSQFNYFQILVPAILHMHGRWKQGQRAVSLPGEYWFTL